MKVFFALDLEESIRQRLEDLSLRMQQWDLPARWTHAHDFHITLAYIGEIAADELTYVLYNTQDIVDAHAPFSLDIPACGAFAGKKWPRVVYAAVDDQESYASDLHASLCAACTVEMEKNYTPHITICRPQAAGRKRSWAELLAAYAPSVLGDCTVNSISLYESVAGTAQRYKKIETWNFV